MAGMDFWRRRPEIARDAVVAVPFVLVFVLAQQVFGDGGSAVRAVAVVVVMWAALAVRRRWPMATFAAALAMVVLATTGLEFLFLASYTLAAYRPKVPPVAIGIVAAVAMLVGHLRYWPELVLADVAGDLILIGAIAVVPVAVGRAVNTARRTTRELAARNAELVALRESEAAHAVEAERFRMARELHDVVAHHVSAMTVRARAGGHVAARDPQAAQDALAYISQAGTETLTAMGALVGALRGEQAPDAGPLTPQPGLEDLSDLLESFRRTGLVVHADVDPGSVTVEPVLGLNTYRIVQEGLTNAIRHGGAERAWVAVSVAADAIRVQVDDNGQGLQAGHGPAGHGLVGVAERAAMHGGTSSFGASPRGGCRLTATLAVADRSAPDVDRSREVDASGDDEARSGEVRSGEVGS